MTFLEIREVTKQFDKVVALHNVNIEVENGEFLALLGPSGSGKTTALRIIAGLESPTSGKIIINGKQVNHIPPWERDTGVVFQNYALFPHMNVKQNIGYGLRLRKVDKKNSMARINQIASMLEIDDLLNRKIMQLSGGQQQRVALARALAIEPTVLLMDEPLANLDARLRARVRYDLLVLQKKLAITTVYVTHDQDEAFALGDKVAVMNQGKVEQIGTPFDIYYKPKSAFVSSFIGKNNSIIAGEVIQINGSSIKVKAGDLVLESTNFGQGLTVGKEVSIIIRPEEVSICDPNTTAPTNPAKGIVLAKTFLGSELRLHVDIGHTIEILASSQVRNSFIDAGTEIFLDITNPLVFVNGI